jgi:hypothetical protein
MSRKSKEAEDRLVRLPEYDPETFKLYIHLLYTGILAVVPDPVPDVYFGSLESVALARLYVLAENMQDTDAKDAVVEATLGASRVPGSNGYCVPGRESIIIIYAGTLKGSPMRKLLVDFYTFRARSTWIDGDVHWPNDFMRDLTLSLLDKRPIPMDTTKTCEASVYMEVKSKEGP